ncbi:MAG: sensor histidine kinase [Muribaculaceae bacterium]|nr:sensor histidine kinase [Muribaculaceae bacterium]
MNRQSNAYKVLLQFAVAVGMILLPAIMIYTFTHDGMAALMVLCNLAPPLGISFVFFMVNYWWLVPRFLHRGRRAAYVLVNFMLFGVVLFGEVMMWWSRKDLPWDNHGMILVAATGIFFSALLFWAAVVLAMALRNSDRARQLKEQIEEEKRRHTEAELVWLKNQLNPHFLFNTLNNISSLVAFDADRAQDSISRLSDLLRYAMYESAKPTVPLREEVEFMKDYISLMSLRCNDRTTVGTRFEVASPSAHIAPLLLVSIIENSFKHGVSANRPSEISISLVEEGGTLTFECSNTNHAKGSADRSGSSIGLPNTRRRLDLLYHGRYEWTQESDDSMFTIRIKIRL